MSKKRRGRPRKQFAKRNTTTRQGRRTGADPRDRGTDQIRLKRLLVTGSDQLPIEPIAALYGRDLITTAQYNAGRDIADLIAVIDHLQLGSVWLRILSAPGGILNFDPTPEVERASRILHRLSQIIGTPTPVIFALCAGDWRPLRPILNTKTAPDHPAITIISTSLDRVASRWSA